VQAVASRLYRLDVTRSIARKYAGNEHTAPHVQEAYRARPYRGRSVRSQARGYGVGTLTGKPPSEGEQEWIDEIAEEISDLPDDSPLKQYLIRCFEEIQTGELTFKEFKEQLISVLEIAEEEVWYEETRKH
jgi:hypothetical protein